MLKFLKRILNPYVKDEIDRKQVEEIKGKVDWLIAGLGNPGVKYSGTRHNIGWMAASALCSKYNKPLIPFSPVYVQSSLRIEDSLVLVILPTTYMNKSGEAVKSVCEIYGIPYDRLIVVLDEYNFPVGKVHIKTGGGDGGHNGMASVINETGTNEFLRLRCGIGNDFPPGGMVNYVLSDFTREETEARDNMIGKAIESIETVVRMGPAKASSEINSGRLWKNESNENEKNGGNDKKRDQQQDDEKEV